MDDLADLARRISAIERDLWAGPPVKNGLPRVPQLAALPTAAANFEGRLVYVPASSGVAGKVYICRLAADGTTWEWSELDNVAAVDLSAIPFMVGAASGLLSAEYVSGTVPATGYPAIILRGFNTTEQTTVSTSAVDLVSITGLSIPVTSGVIITGVVRKSSGAAAYAGLGLKVNSTVVAEARTDGSTLSFMQLSNSNGAESGNFRLEIMPRSANYLASGQASFVSALGGIGLAARFGNLVFDAFYPNATITALAIRGITASASQTLAVKELAVYEVLYQ